MTITDNESDSSLLPTPSPSHSTDTGASHPSVEQVPIKSEKKMAAAASKANGAGGDGLPPSIPSSSSPNGDDGQPSKRTLQNRKAQREFRERKASYVKSLEQRIRAYENNEIQGNVELQRAARRLKEENDSLREQLRQMQERLTAIEQSQGGPIPMQPNRTPARARGGAPTTAQPPQSLYTQAQGFSNDVAYDVMGQASGFQPTHPQGYPQYFPQVCSPKSKTFF
jgi:hypothetical protein